jgi:hypothetical protein
MPEKKKKQQGIDSPNDFFKGAGKMFPKMPPKKKKKKKKKPLGLKGGKGTPARTEKPGVPHGVDKKTQEGEQILNVAKGGSVSKFPDLSGDGKVTQKDILMGRGVIKKKRGGKVTGRSIGPAGASIVSDDGKRIKQLKKIQKSLLPLDAASVGAVGVIKGLSKLAGRLAKRGYGKARK